MAQGKTVSEFKPPRVIPAWQILLVLALLAGAFIGARPAYRAVKNWRARKLVTGVDALAKDRKWQEAFTKAQAAYNLAPFEPVVARSVAHLYTMLGQRQAFPFWLQVIDSGKATIEDRREILGLAMKLERFEMAEPQLQVLLKSFPDETELLRDAAELFGRRGEIAKALEFARRAVEKEPNNNPLHLLLARLLVSSTVPAERQAGQNALQILARGPDKTALDALLIMKDLNTLSPPEKVFVAGRLMSHPLAGLEHRLWAGQAKLILDPEQRDEIFDGLLRRYPNPNRNERLSLAQWLNNMREGARALKLVPASLAQQDMEFLLVHLNALGILGRWDEIGALLERGAQFEPWIKDLFQARVAKEQGKKSEAEIHWGRLHKDIPDRPLVILFAAQYAEKIGQWEDARKLYRRLVSDPSLMKEATAALIRMAEPTQETRGVLNMLKERLKIAPKDPANQNDVAYLNLLLGEEIDASKVTAENLYSQATNYLAFRVTLALADLRKNHPADALKLLDLKDVAWESTEVLPHFKAIHAVVLGANGKTNEAKALIKRIPSDHLRAEERALIQPWR